MQIAQRVGGRIIKIDQYLNVTLDGKIPSRDEAERIIEEAKRTIGKAFIKIIDLPKKISQIESK